jgi:hypothetical protein
MAGRVIVKGSFTNVSASARFTSALTASIASSPHTDTRGRYYAVADGEILSQPVQGTFDAATKTWTVAVVPVAGVIYRLSAPGYMPDIFVESDAYLPMPANADVEVDADTLVGQPGGDTLVEYVTLTTVIASIDGKVAAEVAEQAPAAVGTELAAQLADPESAASTAVENTAVAVIRESFPQDAVRVDWQNGDTGRAKLVAALAAASAPGGSGVVALPGGTIDVGNGLSLAGYRAGVVGMGGSNGYGFAGAPTGSVIKASTQTGPVLDFNGFIFPDSFRGKIPFSGFHVEGSNAADASKANSGMSFATGGTSAAASSLTFRDIVISRTGGPCIDVGKAYDLQFYETVLCTPVSARDNDVPYLLVRGGNWNGWHGLLLRSMGAGVGGDCGPSGAIVMRREWGINPSQNIIRDPKVEFLHVPTGGCIISIAGNANRIDNLKLQDVSKEAGASGTAVIRLLPLTTGNLGGNEITGEIPAGGASFDVGVDISQSYNSVYGTRGGGHSHVRLNAGVLSVGAFFVGSVGSPTGASVVDNAGNSTNSYADMLGKTWTFPAGVKMTQESGSALAISTPAVPANGYFNLGVGASPVKYMGVGGASYINASAHYFRDPTGTAGAALAVFPTIGAGGGIGLPLVTSALPTASATYRGRVVFVAGASGTADRLVVCRKDAADAYAWMDLF